MLAPAPSALAKLGAFDARVRAAFEKSVARALGVPQPAVIVCASRAPASAAMSAPAAGGARGGAERRELAGRILATDSEAAAAIAEKLSAPSFAIVEPEVGARARQIALTASGAPLARALARGCLLYTSPSPRDGLLSRMPSSA